MTGVGDSRLRRWTPGLSELAKQSALIGCAVLFYFLVRGQTEGSEASAVAHGRALLELEADVGVDFERSMQRWTDDHHLTTLANWVYIWCHWPVIVGMLVWLHHTRIESYLVLRNAMFVSGGLGLVIFMSLPVAPPRLIDAGFVDTVTDYSTSYRLLQPPALVNKYAAMPSLHVGWNLLLGVVFFESSRHVAARCVAIAGPALMALAVVVTANHYILDGVVGAAVALLGLGVSRKITRPLMDLDGRLKSRLPLDDVEDVDSAQSNVDVGRR